MKLLIQFLVVVCGFLAACHHASAQSRVGLVVGTDKYTTLKPLSNAVMDARRFETLLKANKVDVFAAYNADIGELQEKLVLFRRAAQQASEAFIYLAAHGIDEGDYLIFARDGRYSCETRASRNHLRIAEILDIVKDVPKVVVVVDACRERPSLSCPYASRGPGVSSRSIGVLGRPGAIIISSTLSKLAASDGEPGKHSPFAERFFQELEQYPTVFMHDILSETAISLMQSVGQSPELAMSAPPLLCLKGEKCESKTAAVLNVLQPRKPPDPAPARPIITPPEVPAPKATTPIQAAATPPVPVKPPPVPQSTTPVAAPSSVTLAVPPAQPTAQSPASDQSPPRIAQDEINRTLQKLLIETKCYAGKVDGTWGTQSAEAAGTFVETTKLKSAFAKPPSIADLEGASNEINRRKQAGLPTRVCPLVCETGYIAKGESCEPVPCSVGQRRNSDGDCVAVTPEKPPVSSTTSTQTSPPKRSSEEDLPWCTTSYAGVNRCRRKSTGEVCQRFGSGNWQCK